LCESVDGIRACLAQDIQTYDGESVTDFEMISYTSISNGVLTLSIPSFTTTILEPNTISIQFLELMLIYFCLIKMEQL
jgi:hypothetical protein